MLKERFGKTRESDVPSSLGWLVTSSSREVTFTSKLSASSTKLHHRWP